MRLSDIIQKESICHLHATSKDDALRELIDLTVKQHPELEREVLQKAFSQREKLMSTGIGLGIGAPHIRIEKVRKSIIVVGISKKGINDYAAIDSKPVYLIFMILVNKDSHKEYIEILADIAETMKDETLRQALMHSDTTDSAYEILRA